MDRNSALILAIIFFILFSILEYYGAQITLLSSLTFGMFISLTLLNIFYPPSRVVSEDVGFTIIFYVLFQIIGFILISLYILYKTLTDIRS